MTTTACGGSPFRLTGRFFARFFGAGLCAALVLAGCGQAAAQGTGGEAAVQGGAAPPAAARSAESPAPAPDTEVFITNSGRRYHRENCGALRSSSIAVTLAEAVTSGYGPCSICKPPRFDAASGNAGPGRIAGAITDTALYRVNRPHSGASAQGGPAQPAARSGAVDFSRLLPAEVIDHVDGDTIRVRINNPPAELGPVETIRLIGVDTPETVHPRREAEAFGKEASDFTKTRLLGKRVYLAFDWDLRDRYGRLLAYVYTQDQRCHNAELVRQGYGHAYTRFPFQFMEEFRSLEREAREQRRGLWN
ncbi:MAG: thermonuclease family protein [Treponema sp.]|jgi:micrococcal nuclease|nr:thermonuclease family protein [Treponema sp.]